MRGPLQRSFPRDWFVRKAGYRRFMARELTSVFVGGYVVFLLVWLHQLGQGPQQYYALMESMRHPL
ncbi:MAG: hypothetical protein ACE10B_01065, partial [Phycisphaerales bacterium]